MATIRQFKAIRPTADKAREIAALPYDVMDEAEARQTAEGGKSPFFSFFMLTGLKWIFL